MADAPAAVRDVMKPDLWTIDVRSNLEAAAAIMRDNDIGDVLVVQDGQLRGIVTDRDIVVRAIAAGRHPAGTAVGEVASPALHTVSADDTTDKAAEIMSEFALRRLPVIEDEHIVGIVSIGDIAQAEDPKSALAEISSAPPNA
jgi:CBS domain-containing protein